MIYTQEKAKKIKEGLQKLECYFDDYAKNENGDVIDEESDEIAGFLNDAWYYIELLEKEVVNSIPKQKVQDTIRNERNIIFSLADINQAYNSIDKRLNMLNRIEKELKLV